MPSALQGFVHIEEDIVLEAEDALALIPPRAHVPQQLSVAPWVSILRRFHWVFCFLQSAPGFSRLNFYLTSAKALQHLSSLAAFKNFLNSSMCFQMLHSLARGNTLQIFVPLLS